jgi:hypothetical protein
LHATQRILALLLTAVLAATCFGKTQPSPQEQVRAIAANSPVEVKLLDGSTQRGWIGEVSDTGFVLAQEKNHQLANSQQSFVQVKAVKQVKDVKRHKVRNILIGVGVTYLVFAIVASAVIGGK